MAVAKNNKPRQAGVSMNAKACSFHKLEIAFSHTTIGTSPAIGNIFPLGAGRNAISRPSLRFVVNQSTHNTLPFPELATHVDTSTTIIKKKILF
jgi:hypothetical protein